MLNFSPVTTVAKLGRAPVTVVRQAYDTIILPEIVVTTTGPVIVEFTVDLGGFSIKAVSSAVSLCVRDAGVRYHLSGPAGFDAFSVPYEGQALSSDAIFEYWASATGTYPAVTITISTRTGNSPEVTDELTVRKNFPLSFPISNG